MDIINTYESNVRSYCRMFPTLFTRAKGYKMYDKNGNEYIDFFAGAGALNYGHNNPHLKARLLDYIKNDGITHSLDLATETKEDFIKAFYEVVMQPRGMNYKIQFPGPTGTNAVEAALKLARKVTGRTQVISFTNGFHGMTLGALAVTGAGFKRAGAGTSLNDAVSMPYDGYHGDGIDTIEIIKRYLEDGSSGIEIPAAFIVETVQAEGGVNVAAPEWLKDLERLAKDLGILLIVDDIQVGCGRTGQFFSFEQMGIEPDIICLSKSLSGYGLPLAVTLLKPELDEWEPGEHNGTFRGNNPAFVTATAALDYWTTSKFHEDVTRKSLLMIAHLDEISAKHNISMSVRGRGMIQGLEIEDSDVTARVVRAAFNRGLIIETSGPEDNVLKLLPPLTIDEEGLCTGLKIIDNCIEEVVKLKPAPKLHPVSKDSTHPVTGIRSH